MTTYKSIVGQKIQKVSSDPPAAAGGQIWYNTTTGVLKGVPFIQAWASVGPVTVARRTPGGTGPQTAALACGGGNPSPALVSTEEYNGSGWATGADLGTGRYAGTAAGDQTSGLYFGGATSSNVERNETEEYNGTSWSEQNNLSQARQRGAGAGSQTAALFFGGSEYVPATNFFTLTEQYDGTDWTSGGALNNLMRGQAGFGTQTAALSACGNEPTLAISEEYNGTSWTSGNFANTARTNISGGGIQTSGLIFGGTTDGSSGNRTGATEAYDGTSFTNVPSLSTSRRLGGGAGTDQNAGLYFAGYTTTDISLTEEFTSSTNIITSAAWATGGTMGTTRRYLAGLGTRPAALAAGGSTSSPGLNETANSEEYDGTSWTEGNNLGTARIGLGGAGVQTSSIAAGGRTPGNVNTTASEEYNGTSWTATPNLNTGRRYVAGFGASETAAVVSGGVVGGAPGSGTAQDATEHYNGSAWTSGGALNTAKRSTSGNTCGTETAGIYITDATVEEYNGSSWSEQNDPNRGPSSGGGGVCGSQTASMFAGNDSVETLCELYDGTSFVTTANLSTGRGYSGGAGATSATGTIFGGFIGPSSPKTTAATEEFTGETTAVNVKTLSTS